MPTPLPPQPEPKYRLQHLIDYLSLVNHITGELPKEVAVSKEFYDWYKSEVEGTAKRLGVPHPDVKEPVFDNIKIVVKK